jgi:hypothetical protein
MEAVSEISIGQTASVSCFNYLYLGEGVLMDIGSSRNSVKPRAAVNTIDNKLDATITVY